MKSPNGARTFRVTILLSLVVSSASGQTAENLLKMENQALISEIAGLSLMTGDIRSRNGKALGKCVVAEALWLLDKDESKTLLREALKLTVPPTDEKPSFATWTSNLPTGPDEIEEILLEELNHTKTGAERDEIYFKLALLLVMKNDFKARDYVFKIDESEFRKRAEAWVDWELAVGAIKKKAVEPALELARMGELTRIQRIWVLTESAKLLAKNDRQKAVFLISDASNEVGRISKSDSDKASGLLAIANAQRLVDPAAVWETVFEAANAAESAEGFTGEGGKIFTTVNSKSQILRRFLDVPDFDVGIFSDLTSDDYDRTIQLASGFRRDVLRSNIMITIARSVLNVKRTQAPKPKVVAK